MYKLIVCSDVDEPVVLREYQYDTLQHICECILESIHITYGKDLCCMTSDDIYRHLHHINDDSYILFYSFRNLTFLII